jgi:2-polyprenyl-3-methyl-5-hydroxy-6-metoxy-1,4-benzoquinol methylase
MLESLKPPLHGRMMTAADPSTIQISKDEGVIEIHPAPNGQAGFEIVLRPHRSDLYIPRSTAHSTLPLELIRYWAERSDFAWFCNSIARHEDQTTVPGALRRQLFAYLPAEQFADKRLLDFGCGTGASTFALARMLPQTQVVGVELDADRVDIANRIRSCLGLNNVNFECSPSGDQLPTGTGNFDFVMLSAVYEHLLPAERKILMPLLWSALKPGGIFFLNQTPYRYSPLEAHSTGLWFINYMPDALAHWTVRHFAGRNPIVNKSPDWNVHLRGGLRGGTEKGIITNLTQGDTATAHVLQPQQNGLRDRADYWLSATNPRRYRVLKKSIASFFRFTDRILGTIPGINLEVVIQKLPAQN